MWNLPTTNIGYQFQKNVYILWAKQNISASQIQPASCQFVSSDAYTWRCYPVKKQCYARGSMGWGDTVRWWWETGQEVREGFPDVVFEVRTEGQDVSSLIEQEMLWMEAIPGGRTECDTNQRCRSHLQLACCFDHWSRHEQKEFKQQISKAHLSHFHVWGSGAPSPYDPLLEWLTTPDCPSGAGWDLYGVLP